MYLTINFGIRIRSISTIRTFYKNELSRKEVRKLKNITEVELYLKIKQNKFSVFFLRKFRLFLNLFLAKDKISLYLPL